MSSNNWQPTSHIQWWEGRQQTHYKKLSARSRYTKFANNTAIHNKKTKFANNTAIQNAKTTD